MMDPRNKVTAKPADRSEARIAVLVFLVLLVSYSYFPPRWADWNQNSRLDLVMAIVDRGSLSIDDYYDGHTPTGDYAIWKGHVYSTKAPGSAFLGVPVYWVFQRIMGGSIVRWGLSLLRGNEAIGSTFTEDGSGLLPQKLHSALALWAITFCIVSIPSALLGVVLYRFTGHAITSPVARLWAVLAYGLSTSAFPYSGAFYGHQIVAVLLFTSFYLAFLIGQGKAKPWHTLAVGFMLGYAVITEYPAVLIASATMVYLCYRLPRKEWVGLAVLGGLLPGLVWMVHNYAIFGKVVAFGYEHAPLWQDVNTAGFFSLVYPQPEALWGITFGRYRGLFFLSPVMLLSVLGLCRVARKRLWLPECLVCLWAAVTFFLFNGSSVMWQGGYAIGPRYLVPMLPFLVLPLAFSTELWGMHWWAKVLVGLVSIWSFLATWLETISGQQFPDYTPNPLFRYSLPRFLEGDIARNLGTTLGLSAWASLIPLGIAFLVLAVALVRTLRSSTRGAASV